MPMARCSVGCLDDWHADATTNGWLPGWLPGWLGARSGVVGNLSLNDVSAK